MSNERRESVKLRVELLLLRGRCKATRSFASGGQLVAFSREPWKGKAVPRRSTASKLQHANLGSSQTEARGSDR
jgi:hypothetical protein